MEKKVTAVLDLTDCKTWWDLHSRIQEALHFPDFYGKNWDAFWDSINVDTDVEFVTIVGTTTVAEELKPEIEIMKGILEENKLYWADSKYPFDYEILS